MQKTNERSIYNAHDANVVTLHPRHGYNENTIQSQLEVFYNAKILSKQLNSAAANYDFFMQVWDHSLIGLQEQLYILYMNNNLQVIAWKCVNTGNGSQLCFDLKFALSMGLNCMASRIIIAHNHPSGILKPSMADKYLTERLSKAAALLDIKLEDHLIVTKKGYYSFADNDVLKN